MLGENQAPDGVDWPWLARGRSQMAVFPGQTRRLSGPVFALAPWLARQLLGP